ncbi:MAG TPA: GAF domain-containing protein [Candidatus Limnocylindrales bacterium]|nr:GAF domain-containing protein [Candidatus Limnocylindrales bacterium]
MTTAPLSRPADATLSVTKAARLLGVHPNTIRAWSDQGRLRYYRINPRGDRRYRLSDLQRFLAAAETSPEQSVAIAPRRLPPRRPAAAPPARLPGANLDPGALLVRLAELAPRPDDVESTLTGTVDAIQRSLPVSAAVVLEHRPEGFVVRAAAGSGPLADRPATFGSLAQATRSGRPVVASQSTTPGWLPIVAGTDWEIVAPIAASDVPWGCLVVAGVEAEPGENLVGTVAVAASLAGSAIRGARLSDTLEGQARRSDALRRVASDLGSRLKLDSILDALVDHALVMFGADRAAVFRIRPGGPVEAAASRGLSDRYLAAVRDFPTPSIGGEAVAQRRPVWAIAYARDPRGQALRAAVVQEGFDSICCAPLYDDDELLGLLTVYHDRPHPWAEDEIATLDALARHAAMAIRTAEDYTRMASWAAQLQSIQALGTRLARLADVGEIGHAIATELRQLIDYHNVRVYRIDGEALVPVAMQGQVGEYVDETPEQLRSRVGEGITGWVALHKVAQNLPDAAADPRTQTIPGTEDDLDESMLLAPMLYEDEVLGVVVLSKLGLHQFRDDDLRLLEIYASFAAQAMANADATERLRAQSAALERQLSGQRALLQITESILTTLDPQAVLEQVAERLAELVRYDTIAIEVVDRTTGLLMPLSARGVDAAAFMEPWAPGETGLATWVVEHNEPVLVADERLDARVNHGSDGPIAASLICLPLRGREGATGVLSLERLGETDRFGDDEFELVKLFAAQVSIALQNAERHTAVEIRARTDALTGLLNHGTFTEWLARSAASGEPFSLVMIDLDDFKGVNDAFGHQAGDRVLETVARAIIGAGRETDRVFRYGGDEFALILPGSEGVAARAVAERVQAAIEPIGEPGGPWAADGIGVSASIGVASFPDDGRTPADVLLAADRACFVAKRSGRGQIATAAEGLAIAGEFSLKQPTPVDPPSIEPAPAVEEVVTRKRGKRPFRAA